jgi:hypothetical protein
MKRFEYVLSVAVAMLLLGGVVAWTHVEHQSDTATVSCRTHVPTLKGMSIARCTPGKRG